MVAIPDITQQKCMLSINKGINRAIGFATELVEAMNFPFSLVEVMDFDNFVELKYHRRC